MIVRGPESRTPAQNRSDTMGDVINFPISLDSDRGRELIQDCCRFYENILTEKQVRKKYRLAESDWVALANESIGELIETE